MSRGRSPLWLGVGVAVAAVLGLLAAVHSLEARNTSGVLPVGTRTSAALSPSTPRTIEVLLHSAALGADVPYLVHLPSGYDSSPKQRYSVLYMLHGLGGNRYQWRDLGLFDAADGLVASGEIQPMIIVTPEGQSSYWIDEANNGPRWGTYVTQDLVAEVDGKYRTIANPYSRAIGGDSMGAHGALQLAMNSNDFGVVGAHSIALRNYQQALPIFGDKAYFEAHDPVSLCKKEQARAQKLVIWMDIGLDDGWLTAANAFHDQLVSTSIPHLWHVYSGGHDGDYWRSHLQDYLFFYNSAFSQSGSVAARR